MQIRFGDPVGREPRIETDGKVSGLGLAVARDPHRVTGRRRCGPALRLRRPHDHAGEHDGALLPEIPGKAVHPLLDAYARWGSAKAAAARLSLSRRWRRVLRRAGK